MTFGDGGSYLLNRKKNMILCFHFSSFDAKMKAYLLLLALVLLLSTVSAEDPLCCVCEGCASYPSDRGGLYIDSGVTCGSLELEMATQYEPGDSTCTSLVNQYRDTCCNADITPSSVSQPQASTDKYDEYPQGEHAYCELCWKDSSFPTKPYTVNAILYIDGYPTCEDLYYMGHTGNIPDRLCYPLQDAMQGPCGCGLGGGGEDSDGHGNPSSGGYFSGVSNWFVLTLIVSTGFWI